MERAKKKVENGEITLERKGLPRKNKPVMLPKNITWLKQSNILTLMAADFSVLQLKTVILLVEKMQRAIQQNIDCKEEGIIGSSQQLSLFTDNSNIVSIELAYKDLGIQPYQYAELKVVLKQLTSIPVELKTIDAKTGDRYCSYQALVAKVILNETKKWSRNFEIQLDKDIALAFIDIDKGYTKFIKEIAFNAKCKYTVRMYMLISSWAQKGGFEMTVKEFRKLFMLGKKYAKYKDLYKRVIRPAYEELHENADCWFEVAEKYALPNDSEPYKLAFKVIRSSASKAEEEKLDKIKENIANMCYEHFHMVDWHMQQLLPKITLENAPQVYNKIIYLGDYIKNNRVKSDADYALKGLMKEIDNIHS